MNNSFKKMNKEKMNLPAKDTPSVLYTVPNPVKSI